MSDAEGLHWMHQKARIMQGLFGWNNYLKCPSCGSQKHEIWTCRQFDNCNFTGVHITTVQDSQVWLYNDNQMEWSDDHADLEKEDLPNVWKYRVRG